MLIAHALIDSLGERRANTILAMLENPDLVLASADRHAFDRFLDRLTEHYGPEQPAVRQLSHLRKEGPDCPE